jgi:hypothetical protein
MPNIEMKIDREAFRRAAVDPSLCDVRQQLVRFTSKTFAATGELLHVGGHLLGSDRVTGQSPFGHGNGQHIYAINEEMAKRYAEWKTVDLLVNLPPPP